MRVLENETTEYIKQAIIATRQSIKRLEDELQSINDFLEDCEKELKFRGV